MHPKLCTGQPFGECFKQASCCGCRAALRLLSPASTTSAVGTYFFERNGTPSAVLPTWLFVCLRCLRLMLQCRGRHAHVKERLMVPPGPAACNCSLCQKERTLRQRIESRASGIVGDLHASCSAEGRAPALLVEWQLVAMCIMILRLAQQLLLGLLCVVPSQSSGFHLHRFL